MGEKGVVIVTQPELFSPSVAQWFSQQVGEPTLTQQMGWPQIASGRHVLICAPTGTGKTLTAFLGLLDRLIRAQDAGEPCLGTQVLYVTPLKALGNDIERNLNAPIAGINQVREAMGLPPAAISVGVRNGDTPAHVRQRLIKSPPHILITTPESLFLMLTTQRARQALATVNTVIVDELHAFMDSKRGVHLALSLERLAHLAGEFQRIGLSATVEPEQLAADFLGGGEPTRPRPVNVVRPAIDKAVDLQLRCPVDDFSDLPEGSIWPELSAQVYELSRRCRTTLVFVNHRTAAERICYGINALAGAQYARTHHGSVSKDQRLEAESLLKAGKLRCLCATSSMELGIDVGEIDLVIQVACPFSVASGLQRLGRAGHAPGAVSVMRVMPRTCAELLDCAMVVEEMRRTRLEPLHIPQNCLDVLAQQIVSMAAEETWEVEDLYRVLRRAQPYQGLTRDSLRELLRMLAGDWEHARERPVSPRVSYDRLRDALLPNTYSRLLALSAGGTIPDRGYFGVYLEDNRTRLGELDEEYVFEARVGDVFLLGAFAWRITGIDRERVRVAPASRQGAQTPFWKGDGLGRSFFLSMHMAEQKRQLERALADKRLRGYLQERYGFDEAALDNLCPMIQRQYKALGHLAHDRKIILEHFSDAVGQAQMVVHAPFGARVNIPLAMILQRLLQDQLHTLIMTYHTDDGILLHAPGLASLPQGVLHQAAALDVEAEILRALPTSALFTSIFRECCARALLMGVRKAGRMPLWIQRLRGSEMLQQALSAGAHPMLREAARECTQEYMDLPALKQVLAGVNDGDIQVIQCRSQTPSPWTLQLRRNLEGVMLYDTIIPENAQPGALDGLAEPEALEPPTAEDVAQCLEGQRRAPRDAQALHTRLMIQGDCPPPEAGDEAAWLGELTDQGQAVALPGRGLVVAAEEAALYGAALAGDGPERERVIRRCLRYNGMMGLEQLAERYGFSLPEVMAVLARLMEREQVVPLGEGYVHADLYRQASGLHRRARSAQIATAPPAAYAAWLPELLRGVGDPADQLEQVLTRLRGWPQPLKTYERIILPGRVPGFTPQLLEGLLSQGRILWRAQGEDICFYPADTPLEDALPRPEGLSPLKEALLDLLAQLGASFYSALSARLPGQPVMEALLELLQAGLVVQDSLACLHLDNQAAVKVAVRGRVAAMGRGRFSLAYPPAAPTPAEQVNRVLDRYGILCRETCQACGVSLGELREAWLAQELSGQLVRGYFVLGLSGAQLVRERDVQALLDRLAHPSAAPCCLHALDPALAYGAVLPHGPNAAFALHPGAAAVLLGGEVALVLEGGGRRLRLIRPEAALSALNCLAGAFQQGRVYADRNRLALREGTEGCEAALQNAGFEREMLDWILWRQP
jgi:ATP-dependent Lhr-like helicase